MIGLVKDRLLSIHEAAARLNMKEQDLQKRIDEGIKAWYSQNITKKKSWMDSRKKEDKKE